MELQEVFELSFAILGSLGGGGAIIFGFSGWLGKVWANRLMEKEKAGYAQEIESLRSRLTRDAESYKIKLKKSEFLFQKEFEAASEFVALKQRFSPAYSYPDMEWYDACNEIAGDFDKIEVALISYLSKHGAVLKPGAKELLGLSIGISGKNKFEIIFPDVPDHVNKAADELYDNILKIEEILLQQVYSQSSA